jgi:hypothetical protein
MIVIAEPHPPYRLKEVCYFVLRNRRNDAVICSSTTSKGCPPSRISHQRVGSRSVARAAPFALDGFISEEMTLQSTKASCSTYMQKYFEQVKALSGLI